MDSTFSALQYIGRDLKKSLDVSSSTDIDRELKELALSVETVHDSLERAKKSHEVNFPFCLSITFEKNFIFRKMNYYVIVSNEH